jgi:hypothetical protein
MSEKDHNTTMVEEKDTYHLEKINSTAEEEHRNELGQDAHQLDGYWGSTPFIGSLAAMVLMANSLFCGYSFPVSTGPRFSCKSDDNR